MEDGITFECFLVSVFSSSLLWISAQYKWRQHRFLPPLDPSKMEVEFSLCTRVVARSPRAVLIGCGTYGFVQLLTWNGGLIASLLHLSFPTLE
jgi:hypothetical protein